MRILATLFFALTSLPAFAEQAPSENLSSSQYNVRVDQTESRLLFGLYGEFSSFSRQGKSLTGENLEAIANYAILDKAAVQLSLGQSLDMANGLTVLYTGLRVGGAYALMGNFIRRASSVNVNGQPNLSVNEPDADMLAIDAAIDQYLFNGESTVIPATGLSGGIRYDRKLWRLRVSAMARYGALVITSEPVSMFTAGLGLLVRF